MRSKEKIKSRGVLLREHELDDISAGTRRRNNEIQSVPLNHTLDLRIRRNASETLLCGKRLAVPSAIWDAAEPEDCDHRDHEHCDNGKGD